MNYSPISSKQVPVYPKGGEAMCSSNQTLTWKPNSHQRRKEANFMSSPFGEGQTDMPINRHNLGEVPFHFTTIAGHGNSFSIQL